MDLSTLDQHLFTYTDIEKIQKAEKSNINELNLPYTFERAPKIPKEAFFHDGNIFINKQQRFSHTPAHTHDFVEINYMYSGSCTQYINGEKLELVENQIIVMDKDIVQEIDYIGEKDILINILVHENYLSKDLLFDQMQSYSIFSEFLLKAIREKTIDHHFLFIDVGENNSIQSLLRMILVEYFTDKHFRQEVIKHYFSIFSYEISRELEKQTRRYTETTIDRKIMDIIHYIDLHYHDVSLTTLANQFGYNKNYLSSKIKQELGKGFFDLLNDKRLSVAKTLLKESKKSITDIAYEIGYNDPGYFYKIFKKKYGETPLSYRKKV